MQCCKGHQGPGERGSALWSRRRFAAGRGKTRVLGYLSWVGKGRAKSRSGGRKAWWYIVNPYKEMSLATV